MVLTQNRTARLAAASASLLGCLACAAIVQTALTPSEHFVDAPPPQAPRYSEEGSWAALPALDDGADRVPLGAELAGEAALADVFFVHPTTYFGRESWNQSMSDADVNGRVDQMVLPNQASAFNGCCRVFAPRYRQVTLGTFLSDAADTRQAMELAYGDVREAFLTYLERFDRGLPIIVASHSQGSYHALRLLAELFENKEVAARLVAAYLVGFPMAQDVFERLIPSFAVCEGPEQTRCVVTWSTYTEDGERPERFWERPTMVRYPGAVYETMQGKTPICVNPLSWRADDEPAPPSENLGAVRFTDALERPEPVVGLVGARCDGGLLRIGEPQKDGFPLRSLGRGNLHLSDYGLFYMNIRDNAVVRSRAWHAAHP